MTQGPVSCAPKLTAALAVPETYFFKKHAESGSRFWTLDDVFLPDKLKICFEKAVVHDKDFITHDLAYLKAGGEVVGRISNALFLQASIINREFTKGIRFSETLEAGEDTQFFSILKQNAKHMHISEILTAIRIRKDSQTDRCWFEKRLIELWHTTQGHLSTPHNIDGYIDYCYSFSIIKRSNFLRKWLGQKFGRQAGGAVLSAPARRW